MQEIEEIRDRKEKRGAERRGKEGKRKERKEEKRRRWEEEGEERRKEKKRGGGVDSIRVGSISKWQYEPASWSSPL